MHPESEKTDGRVQQTKHEVATTTSCMAVTDYLQLHTGS